MASDSPSSPVEVGPNTSAALNALVPGSDEEEILPEGTELYPGLKIIRKLGSGGQGDVYEVEAADGRRLAAKLLLKELSDDSKIITRLKREAEMAKGVSHPNVVRMGGVLHSELAGRVFILMELVEGRSLRDFMPGRAMDLGQAVDFTIQIARGLQAVHDTGVVHRDLKPTNVLVTETAKGPLLKVMDFGIAKADEEEATRVTVTGAILGTPAYMSPEQAVTPGEVDGRSDLYSLGVLLFEMLTGRPPFATDRVAQVIMQHAHAPAPNPRSLNPRVPPAIAQVVLKCLAKKPEDRYVNMSELVYKLDQARRIGAHDRPRVVDVPELSIDPRQVTPERIAKDVAQQVRHHAGSVARGVSAPISPRLKGAIGFGAVLLAIGIWFLGFGDENLPTARLTSIPPGVVDFETIIIRSNPPGARIIVDGERLEDSSGSPLLTPARVEHVANTRSHVVMLQKQGYLEHRGPFSPHDSPLEIELKPERSHVKIRVAGRSANMARIFFDEKQIATGSFALAYGKPGPHKIRAQVDACEVVREVSLEAGGRIEVELQLGC